jgi:hypothetical protein
MPTLPTYTSQQKITTQQSEVTRTGAEAPYEMAGKAISATQDAAVKWSNALDTIQYTTAKANYETGVAQLEAKALADPDYNNSDAYYKELAKLKTDNTKGFQNKAVESRMAFEIDNANQIAQIKIGTIFRKKQIEYTRGVAVPKAIEALQAKMLISSSPEEFAQAKKEINDLVDINVSSGVYSYEDGEKLKKEAELTAAQNSIYTDPVKGRAEVEAGLYDITAKQKSDLIISANRLEKSRAELADWQIKQTQTQGAFDLSQGLASGTLTPAIVRNAQQSGLIDSETAAIFDGVLTKGDYVIPDNTMLGKPDYFLRLLDDSLKDKVEVMKIIKDATTAYGNKELGANQYAYFISEANKRFQAERKGEFGLNPLQIATRNSINGIKSFNKMLTGKEDPKSLARQLVDFLFRLDKGETPKAAEDAIVKQQIDQQLTDYNKGKKIQVRRKSDGVAGSLLEEDFNPEYYEKI